MQRTVKATKFTYVENTINEQNQIQSTIKTIEVPEANEKKALKIAQKTIGLFKPLKTEITEKLYVLDDEIFFKYAKVKED